jgi:hypothetical protein
MTDIGLTSLRISVVGGPGAWHISLQIKNFDRSLSYWLEIEANINNINTLINRSVHIGGFEHQNRKIRAVIASGGVEPGPNGDFLDWESGGLTVKMRPSKRNNTLDHDNLGL